MKKDPRNPQAILVAKLAEDPIGRKAMEDLLSKDWPKECGQEPTAKKRFKNLIKLGRRLSRVREETRRIANAAHTLDCACVAISPCHPCDCGKKEAAEIAESFRMSDLSGKFELLDGKSGNELVIS